jgi:type II secretory pathway component PulF
MLTPRQLSQRAELYHQLASLISAGVPLISALEMARDSRSHRAAQRPLGIILSLLAQGAPFNEALRVVSPNWLPAFDVALLQAGEQSGRLDVCFRFLSEYYGERARLARQIISDLAYPAFVVHIALLIFPTHLLTRLVWQGDVVGFLLAKAAVFIPLYAVVFLLLYLGGLGGRGGWRRGFEALLRRVPVLGPAQAKLALARLSIALERLINAGVSIVEAWKLAAEASGSPALRRTVAGWQTQVLNGVTPAEAVRESGAFPKLFADLYKTGEITGQLDSTLRRLYTHYQEEALNGYRAVAQWTPRLVYFVVMLLIAYQVVSFWSGYYSQIGDLTS